MGNNHSMISTPFDIPDKVDDLKRIKGIGQGVETRLNQAGLFTFAQLAASSPEHVSGILADMIGMSPEKIEDQDWTGQARQLVEEAKFDELIKIQMSPADQQRYETFSVKLLVDEAQQVRRTNIVHVQKGTEQNWAGWDETRLIAFVVENAALDITTAKTTLQMSVESFPAIEEGEAISSAEETQTVARHGHPHHHPRELHIQGMEIYEKGSATPSNIIAVDQDWSIRLVWTLTGREPLFGHWLLKLYLESMGPGKEYALPDDDGLRLALVDYAMESPNVFSYAKELHLEAGDIEPGIYWLFVTVAWEKYPGKLGNLMGFSEKTMLQIYKR